MMTHSGNVSLSFDFVMLHSAPGNPVPRHSYLPRGKIHDKSQNMFRYKSQYKSRYMPSSGVFVGSLTRQPVLRMDRSDGRVSAGAGRVRSQARTAHQIHQTPASSRPPHAVP